MRFDSERQAFLTKIAEEPENYTVRVIYADWLDDHGEHEEADRQRNYEAAEKWLKEFADQLGGNHVDWDEDGHAVADEPITYEQVVQAGITLIDRGEYFIQYGSTVAQRVMAENRSEFWKNWSIVTGREVKGDARHYGPFSCSC